MASLTGLQLRAARALLRWRPQDLAKKSRVGKDLILRAELLDGEVNMTDEQKETIVRVFDMAGVSLVCDEQIGHGAAYMKRGSGSSGLIG